MELSLCDAQGLCWDVIWKSFDLWLRSWLHGERGRRIRSRTWFDLFPGGSLAAWRNEEIWRSISMKSSELASLINLTLDPDFFPFFHSPSCLAHVSWRSFFSPVLKIKQSATQPPHSGLLNNRPSTDPKPIPVAFSTTTTNNQFLTSPAEVKV
jgi:hypothetical protein